MKARAGVARHRPDSRTRGSQGVGHVTPELELKFVEPNLAGLLTACRDVVAGGAETIALRPPNDLARALADAAAAELPTVQFVTVDVPAVEADATALCVTDANELSRMLLDYLDETSGCVIAPITSSFWSNRPLFLIAIPKAGTHALYELARLFGYQPGITCPSQAAPGVWYCVEYSNSHTSAPDFFIDTVRRSPFGNRHHPFLTSPAIFIYRNPLDIVVSEANYYHGEGKAAFSGYLSGSTFEDRLLRLIDDPWLFGSIRQRIGRFLPWLEFENVIPVSFEELIGPSGGGAEAVQRALIWSLQLKLHVPGRPAEIGRGVFNETSPTFHKGQIGAHERRFSPEALKRFFSLPQDFMETLGYSHGDRKTLVPLSARAESFRRRPLRVSEFRFEQPVAIEDGYRGFNIVLFDGAYFGVPQALGVVDVGSPQFAQLVEQGECIRGRSLEQLKESVDVRFVRSSVPSPTEHLEPELVRSRERETYLENMLATALGALRRAEQRADDLRAARDSEQTSRASLELELDKARNDAARDQALSEETLAGTTSEHVKAVAALEARLAEASRLQQTLDEVASERRALVQRLETQELMLRALRSDVDRAVSEELRQRQQVSDRDRLVQRLRDQAARAAEDAQRQLVSQAEIDRRITEIETMKDREKTLREWIDRLQRELVDLRSRRLFGIGPRLGRDTRTPRGDK